VTELAIDARELSKAYRVGMREAAPDTLVKALFNLAKTPARNLRRLKRLTNLTEDDRDAEDAIWALRGVTFQVHQGEILGIIGSNGAGKSTLLKVLTGITEPTGGKAVIRGRIAGLLEVGTGFHPDLTGRENVYLNGTILGMSRKEIDGSFEEIVEFAEVRRFIDTPIKWYSSGMAVRLAFSVAAHLNADVLLIDEVLAVGDAAFQEKCLGRMEGLATSGRTVLFVSHNMSAITTLCNRCLWIENGQVKFDGDAGEAVERYIESSRVSGARDLRDVGRRAGFQGKLMRSVRLLNGDTLATVIKTGEALRIEIDIEPFDMETGLSLGVQVVDNLGQRVLDSRSGQYDVWIPSAHQIQTVHARFDSLPLRPGFYSVTLMLGTTFRDLEVIPGAISFEVVWNEMKGIRTPPMMHWGPLFLPVSWSIGRARKSVRG